VLGTLTARESLYLILLETLLDHPQFQEVDQSVLGVLHVLVVSPLGLPLLILTFKKDKRQMLTSLHQALKEIEGWRRGKKKLKPTRRTRERRKYGNLDVC
jgi:hypothetical protein